MFFSSKLLESWLAFMNVQCCVPLLLPQYLHSPYTAKGWCSSVLSMPKHKLLFRKIIGCSIGIFSKRWSIEACGCCAVDKPFHDLVSYNRIGMAVVQLLWYGLLGKWFFFHIYQLCKSITTNTMQADCQSWELRIGQLEIYHIWGPALHSKKANPYFSGLREYHYVSPKL